MLNKLNQFHFKKLKILVKQAITSQISDKKTEIILLKNEISDELLQILSTTITFDLDLENLEFENN